MRSLNECGQYAFLAFLASTLRRCARRHSAVNALCAAANWLIYQPAPHAYVSSLLYIDLRCPPQQWLRSPAFCARRRPPLGVAFPCIPRDRHGHAAQHRQCCQRRGLSLFRVGAQRQESESKERRHRHRDGMGRKIESVRVRCQRYG